MHGCQPLVADPTPPCPPGDLRPLKAICGYEMLLPKHSCARVSPGFSYGQSNISSSSKSLCEIISSPVQSPPHGQHPCHKHTALAAAIRTHSPHCQNDVLSPRQR